MSAPNEITEAMIQNRLKLALAGTRPEGETQEGFNNFVELAARSFADFVGVVGRATRAERDRAVATCRRLGHAQTARVIADGK